MGIRIELVAMAIFAGNTATIVFAGAARLQRNGRDRQMRIGNVNVPLRGRVVLRSIFP
jgi:hypothetical protein